MEAEFDMDNIDIPLTIETSGAGATGGSDDTTFSAITETTAQTVVVDGTSLTAGDFIVTNAASTTTKFNINGGGVTDTIAGSNAADTLTGGDGADKLTGNDGADSIVGGEGADVIAGGEAPTSLPVEMMQT